ncbi:MAG: hypothetical protein NPIRA03_30640 [Nitrospirales bacterium]|nr:MAG: hypothetical protein NPIRA03_30640 [Nitrospirales bacterium]
MSLVRQSMLTGERQSFVSASAIAFMQERKPDLDLCRQFGVEPSKALIHLHHKPGPINPR